MKKLFYLMSIVVLSVALVMSGCKPKDADIKKAIETALAKDDMAKNLSVSVEKGVATLSGVCMDDACKSHCEGLVKAIKGVKSVVNNCTVEPVAPPAPQVDVNAMTQGVADALKDVPGVKATVNAENKIVLVGEIAKAKWVMVKQMLDKLKPNGYDLSGLKIK